METSNRTFFETASEIGFEDRQWLDQQVASIEELLRNNFNQGLHRIAQKLLDELCNLLNASRGAFFIPDDQHEQFDAVATYAVGLDHLNQQAFRFGEGFIGQAAENQKPIYLDDLPPQNAIIASGIAEMSGRCLLAMPLLFNDSVQGVLEIIRFHPLQPREMNLLTTLNRTVAATLQNIRNNEHNRQLLEELQRQTEQMRAQEEEMRQNMEELQSTQEQIEHSREELLRYKTFVDSFINNTDDTIFIIDRNYDILLANNTLKDRFRKEGIELREGVHLPDVIGQEHFQNVWKERYDLAFSGERFEFTQERQVGERNLYVKASVFPVYNEQYGVIGCSVVSKDISEYKNSVIRVQELEEEVENLRAENAKLRGEQAE